MEVNDWNAAHQQARKSHPKYKRFKNNLTNRHQEAIDALLERKEADALLAERLNTQLT